MLGCDCPYMFAYSSRVSLKTACLGLFIFCHDWGGVLDSGGRMDGRWMEDSRLEEGEGAWREG